MLVPAVLVVGPLGAFGTPANIIGLVCLASWACARLQPDLGLARGFQPVRIALLCFASSVLLSYVAGMRRPLELAEINAADRGLLFLLSWCGIALVTADGLATREQVETLLRRMVLAACFLALVGYLQFFLGLDLSHYLRVPGLRENGVASFLQERGGLRRVAGTASHPIEFGVVLAAVLPIAVHFGLHDLHRSRLRRWAPVLVISGSVLFSISRSAIIGIGLGLAVLLPSWPWRLKLRALAAVPFFLVVMRAAVPGLVGTILNLFLLFGQDTSTTARTEDYAAVTPLIERHLLLGIGFHTYLPNVYHRVLDNQYLGSLVETGVIGIVLLLLTMLIAITTALVARRGFVDPAARHLALSLVGALSAMTVSFATFDALSFGMFDVVVFLLIGTAGALWRISRTGQDHPIPAGPPATPPCSALATLTAP